LDRSWVVTAEACFNDHGSFRHCRVGLLPEWLGIRTRLGDRLARRMLDLVLGFSAAMLAKRGLQAKIPEVAVDVRAGSSCGA